MGTIGTGLANSGDRQLMDISCRSVAIALEFAPIPDKWVVGTEHLLVAVCETASGCAKLLKGLGVTEHYVRSRLPEVVGAPIDDRAKIEVKYAEPEIGIGGTGLFSESANLSLGLARGGGPEEVLFRIGIGILTYPGIGAFLVETISPLSLSELVEGINRSIRGFH